MIPISLQIFATIGAPPVPVPPPDSGGDKYHFSIYLQKAAESLQVILQ
jgi:hypothetical protein